MHHVAHIRFPHIPAAGPVRLALIFAVAAALTLTCGFLPHASAQLMVNLKLNKDLYVAYEPINAEITVSNRAGRDIVLGGPAGSSWLNFDLATDSGDPILPAGAQPVAGSTVLEAGKSYTLNVSLGKFYPLGQPRNYRVRASVYFAGTGQFMASRPQLFGVLEPRTIWEQVIGVPPGRSGAGSYRKYSLMIHRDTQRTLLYVRVQDQTTKRMLATYSLGRLIEVRDPQATIDGNNRLHVLFLGAPRTYTHKVIDYGGETLQADIYRDEGGAPQMLLDNAGQVTVQGGMLYDPDLATLQGGASGSGLPGDAPLPSIRRLSERPQGIPYLGN